MTRTRGLAVLGLALGTAYSWQAAAQARPQAAGPLDRTVLPIAEPKTEPITTLDARDAKAPPRFEVKAPQGAPNVVIVLIDDIGFGHSSAFGGPIQHADAGPAGGRRPELQPLPHHGAVQPDPHGPADGPQPSRQQRRRDHGARHGLPRQHRHPPPDASRRWPRSCARTATARAPSASTTRRRPGRSRPPAPTTAGRRAPASTSSTASSAAKPTSGRRPSTTASRASSTSGRPTTTSPWT